MALTAQNVGFAKMTDEILSLGIELRFIGILDEGGTVVYTKIKNEKLAVFNREEQEMFELDQFVIKNIQKVFDEPLGKVTSICVHREKICQLIYYVNDLIIYITCEPNASNHRVMEISEKILKIIGEFELDEN